MVKKTFSLVTRWAFTLILTLLFALSRFYYMFAMSDVPSILRWEDIKYIFILFAAMAVVLIAQIVVIGKCKIRGSYLLLTVGLLSLLIWVATYLSYRGWDFNIGDAFTNIYNKRIIVVAIVISILLAGSQLLQILLYHKQIRIGRNG